MFHSSNGSFNSDVITEGYFPHTRSSWDFGCSGARFYFSPRICNPALDCIPAPDTDCYKLAGAILRIKRMKPRSGASSGANAKNLALCIFLHISATSRWYFGNWSEENRNKIWKRHIDCKKADLMKKFFRVNWVEVWSLFAAVLFFVWNTLACVQVISITYS